MKNILITGGAGYIGSVLTEQLLENNFNVCVYDSFLYNQHSLNHLCKYDNLSIEKGDVRDRKKIQKFLSKADIIIPLAALVGAPLCQFDRIGSHSINYDAVIDMINELSKNQIVIMPTTNSAYGSGDKDNYCDESSELNPISHYALDKVNLEKKLTELNNFISLRLATVFGVSSRMRLDLLVNDFVYRAFKDKFIVLFESHFVRNYIHIRDVARCFLHTIENFTNMKNQIYNVGLSTANLTKKELCLKIREFIPDFVISENEFTKDPDQRNYIVSNKKIELTGFKPKFELDYGIKELLKLYCFLKQSNHTNY